MGRSVSVPLEACAVAYVDVSWVEDSYEFEEWATEVRQRAQRLFRSLEEADEWLDREDHVIAENQLCQIGVSEYCGLASVWMVSRGEEFRNSGYPDDNSMAGLADNWCSQNSAKFEKEFEEYRRLGSFSNGESVYQKV